MATTASSSKVRNDGKKFSRSKSMIGNREKQQEEAEHGVEESPISQKPIPNYLRHTISSRPDAVKLSRRSNHGGQEDTHLQNQKHYRRRSFERPPSSISSSQALSHPKVQKSLNVSPARPREKTLAPREKKLLSTHSFHGPRTTPKTNQYKTPPSHRPQNSKMGAKNKSLNASSSMKESKKSSENKTVVESGSDATQDSASSAPPVVQVDDVGGFVKADAEVELLDDEVLQLDDKEVPSLKMVESGSDEDKTEMEKIEEEEMGKMLVPSPILENDPNKPDVEGEECKNEIEEVEEKIDENQKVEEETYEHAKDEAKTATEVKQDEAEEKEEVKDSNGNSTDETKNEENQTEKENGAEKVLIDGQVTADSDETSKTETEAEEPMTAAKRQVVQGKKESPSAYNDVIEETASKLLEKRKNKVRALVGAFETVIDYESGFK